MAMTEDCYEYSADRIEIALAFGVPQVEPLGALENDRLLQKFRRGLEIDECAF